MLNAAVSADTLQVAVDLTNPDMEAGGASLSTAARSAWPGA